MKKNNRILSTTLLFIAIFAMFFMIKPIEADAILGSKFLMPQDGQVRVTYVSGDAMNNNLFGLSSPNRVIFGYGHSTYPGATFDLGNFTSGTELVFFVTNQEGTFITGPAWRNIDGVAHAFVTVSGANRWLVSFEDGRDGFDKDYNDIVFNVVITPSAPVCTPHALQKCVGNSVYWFDSCDCQQELIQACTANQICSNGACVNQTVTCSSNSQCGTDAFAGSPFCQGNSVYQNYLSYICNNPGTSSSTCTNATASQLKQTCLADQVCSNGSCNNQVITCSSSSQCGTDAFTGGPFCQGNSIYQNYITYTCNNAGTSSSYCSNSTGSQVKSACLTNQTCSNGTCNDNTPPPPPPPPQCIARTCASYKNAALGKSATATKSSPDAPPSNAVDGDYRTIWNTNNIADASPASLTINMGQEYPAIGYSIQCEGVYGGTAGTIYFYNNSNQTVATEAYTNCRNGLIITGNFPQTLNVSKVLISVYSTGDNVHVNEFTLDTNQTVCGSQSDGCGGTLNCGACFTSACRTDSECGTNGNVGGPFCQGNAVYQGYKTYTCNNPGTQSASCSNATANQLVQTCGANQTCSNGVCNTQNINCTADTDCGANAYTGSPFCQGNSIYQNYITYTCNNSGTAQSYCSNSTASQKKNDCTTSQICSNGSCNAQNITCSLSSDCGASGYIASPFCQGGNVYQDYKTYICNNAGTVSSTCSNSTAPQLKNTCTSGQTCTNGSCSTATGDLNILTSVSPNPASINQLVIFSATATGGNGVYAYLWSGACTGTSQTCSANFTQAGTYTSSVAVISGSQTGTASSSVVVNSSCISHNYTQCSGSAVYYYNSCGVREDIIQQCATNQICQNSQCVSQNISCNSSADCGASYYTGSPFCQGNAIYQNYLTYTCNNAGTSSSYCSNNTASQFKNSCSGNQTCSNGICSGGGGNCTYHSYQQCSGNYLYWFDSCGVQQDSTYCPNGCSGNACQNYTYGNLTINKTVRNITTGNTGFSNSVYAAPGDMLMFMITLQANGTSPVQNVFVKDTFPANLIYQDQLIVSGAVNYYNNAGNIISGINLGTITAGQTVTITYQAQVASAQNFNYGATTLTNSVYTTSNNSGNGSNPTAYASIIVNRTAVYGVSSISTGLTNNLLVDSFIFPLLIALLGFLMFKSGVFVGVERWLGLKKETNRSIKADKELNQRILAIRKTEQI